MPKITSVEPQKSSKRRFNVFLDGQFGFGADEDTVVRFRLISGKEIPAEDLEKVIFETAVGKLMDRMYNLLSFRATTEKEIRGYLKRLNFKKKIKDQEQLSEIVQDALIARLKTKGLLNDLEFTKAWVLSRGSKKSLMVVRGELIKKGVSREIIEQVLSEEGVTDQTKIAQSLLEKKWPRFNNLPPIERKKKAIEFLLRRGFSYDIAKTVIENLLKKE